MIDLTIDDMNKNYCNNFFTKKIVTVILKRIESEHKDPFNLDDILKQLCISKRTLYRRLHEDGITYFDIKDEIKKRYALHLISSGMFSLKEISDLLFFSNTSYFIQSFRRWYKCTPKKWIMHYSKDIA